MLSSCDVNREFNIQQDSNLVGYNNRKLPSVFVSIFFFFFFKWLLRLTLLPCPLLHRSLVYIAASLGQTSPTLINKSSINTWLMALRAAQKWVENREEARSSLRLQLLRQTVGENNLPCHPAPLLSSEIER